MSTEDFENDDFELESAGEDSHDFDDDDFE